MHRRRFLLDLSVCTLALAELPGARRVTWRPRFVADPFSLGIASGDPLPDGVVLWTRLAPDPLAEDGFGGLSDERIAVAWEVADDEAFTKVVRRGVAQAARELAYSVHVEVDGLAPDRWYHYRFTAGDARSPVGRTRTAPARTAAIAPLHFAFVSCQHFEQGLYTAYEHLANERLDLIAHLGDYIYEGAGVDARVRRHDGAEITTLRDYRRRYAQYKQDPALQRAHAMCPWTVTWDDHEVDNNYAGDSSERRDPVDGFLARRAAGYQAWYEHQAVRVPRPTRWSDLAIHRTISWGPLARFWVLDTRQYRTDQACGDGRKPRCAEMDAPDRTLLGSAQERWLADGLAASDARWQVLAQQVMVAPFVATVQEQPVMSMDQWSGYPVAQRRFVETIGARAPGRAVVITGDIHANWANDLRVDFERPDTPVVATEFVGTSISSGGNGSDGFTGARADALRAQNPHIHWHNARRGFVHCTVDGDAWQTRYRTVPFVDRPGAPVETAATFRVEHGRPGVVRD